MVEVMMPASVCATRGMVRMPRVVRDWKRLRCHMFGGGGHNGGGHDDGGAAIVGGLPPTLDDNGHHS